MNCVISDYGPGISEPTMQSSLWRKKVKHAQKKPTNFLKTHVQLPNSKLSVVSSKVQKVSKSECLYRNILLHSESVSFFASLLSCSTDFVLHYRYLWPLI